MDQPAKAAAKPNIVLGADHAGFEMKDKIEKYLAANGYTVDDQGAFDAESVDYPDYARRVCERVMRRANTIGILVCGTGIGMSIAANKMVGIRAAVAHDKMTARLAREHNDANVLTLGARVVKDRVAVQIVREFLNARFEGGRHQRRVAKISELDLAQVPRTRRRGKSSARIQE